MKLFLGIAFWLICGYHIPSTTALLSISPNYTKSLQLMFSISARHRLLEISWRNAQPHSGDVIIITKSEPIGEFVRIDTFTDSSSTTDSTNADLPQTTTDASESVTIQDDFKRSTINFKDSVEFSSEEHESEEELQPRFKWLINGTDALFWTTPTKEANFVNTQIPFDASLVKKLNTSTVCYGYWATYLSANGTRVMTACMRTYPKWMNELKDRIENFRPRDLFFPGTHDSASFKYNFNPDVNETRVTKYSLTQDEDIYSQLLHGIRYIDLRIGYYRASQPKFWANHGVSRQHPLDKILQQVRDFVLETNEIVILDFQEFPVGFQNNKDEVHNQLVQFINRELSDLMAPPSLTWMTTLKDIWHQKKTIIVSYDLPYVVSRFPTMLWTSVQQRWGDVRNLNDLKMFLNKCSKDNFQSLMSRPVAEMAELTPDAWAVITDRLGGLRSMADNVNKFVTQWYFSDIGQATNVVAVDFYRGTNIVEAALHWNSIRNDG